MEETALAVVGQSRDDAVAVLEQRRDGALHVHVDLALDAVILQRPDHLESGSIPDVGQPWIAVPAEVSLENLPVPGPIEERPPGLQLPDAGWSLLGVELRHPPVVDVGPAAHRVGEVDLPGVALVDVGESRRDPPFGHHGVGLPQERLADEADGNPRRLSLDRGAQAGSAGAHDEDVVLVTLNFRHQSSLQSLQMPIESMRT
jgi:hypothetical protein